MSHTTEIGLLLVGVLATASAACVDDDTHHTAVTTPDAVTDTSAAGDAALDTASAVAGDTAQVAEDTSTTTTEREESDPIAISAIAGASVTVGNMTVEIPPGALTQDVTLVAVATANRRTFYFDPGDIPLAYDATFWFALDPTDPTEYWATARAFGNDELLASESLPGEILVEAPFIPTTLVLDAACPTCAYAEPCDVEEDCASTHGCLRDLTRTLTMVQRCDTPRGVCVPDEVSPTSCPWGCSFDTGQCTDADTCSLPRFDWEGDTGVCLCGFPALHCGRRDDGVLQGWNGATCATDADCEGQGCAGLALCLQPGERYPEACDSVASKVACYYDVACAGMCEEQ